jgi:hypothetical protein
MKNMLKTFYAKPLSLYLAAALLAITTFAGPAEAMFVASASDRNAAVPMAASVDRAANLGRIQTALESKIVQQKLMDYGLSPEETMARVNRLSNEQINQLATNMDSLQAGGDGGGFIIGLLVVAILVVVLVYLLQGRIVVK